MSRAFGWGWGGWVCVTQAYLDENKCKASFFYPPSRFSLGYAKQNNQPKQSHMTPDLRAGGVFFLDAQHTYLTPHLGPPPLPTYFSSPTPPPPRSSTPPITKNAQCLHAHAFLTRSLLNRISDNETACVPRAHIGLFRHCFNGCRGLGSRDPSVNPDSALQLGVNLWQWLLCVCMLRLFL